MHEEAEIFQTVTVWLGGWVFAWKSEEAVKQKRCVTFRQFWNSKNIVQSGTIAKTTVKKSSWNNRPYNSFQTGDRRYYTYNKELAHQRKKKCSIQFRKVFRFWMLTIFTQNITPVFVLSDFVNIQDVFEQHTRSSNKHSMAPKSENLRASKWSENLFIVTIFWRFFIILDAIVLS